MLEILWTSCYINVFESQVTGYKQVLELFISFFNVLQNNASVKTFKEKCGRFFGLWAAGSILDEV